MKASNTICRLTMHLILIACVLLLASGYALAQETEEAASAETTTAEAESGTEAEAEDDGTVALNLNNVDIQHVITFLGEITGLPVIKQKDVNVQLSVISPIKVSKEKAFALITEALLLEKIAVVKNQDSVRVIPLDRLSDVVVDLLPSDTDEITGG